MSNDRNVDNITTKDSSFFEQGGGGYTAIVEDSKSWIGDSPPTHVGYGSSEGEAINDALSKRSDFYDD